jgi:hypothetical protein
MVGNMALGQNREINPNGTLGLVYICNTNTNNNFDFLISGLGIGPFQRVSATQPAGNTFSGTGPPIHNFTDIENSNGDDLTYFYSSNSLFNSPMPQFVSTSTVTLTNITTGGSDGCDQGAGTGRFANSSDKELVYSTFAAYQIEIDSLKNLLINDSQNEKLLTYSNEVVLKKANLVEEYLKYLFVDRKENTQEIKLWLDRKGSLKALCLLADVFFEEKNYQDGLLILNEIPNRIHLSEESLQDFQVYLEIKTLVSKLYGERKTVLELEREKLAWLHDIAVNEKTGLSKTLATNILRVYYCTVKESLFFPAEERYQFTDNLLGQKNNDLPRFTLFPNPANNRVSIRFDEKLLLKTGKIEVINSQGIVVKTYLLKENKELFSFDISDITQGVYVCTVTTNEGLKFSQKLIIFK